MNVNAESPNTNPDRASNHVALSPGTCPKCFSAIKFCVCPDPSLAPATMPAWARSGCLLCNPPMYFKEDDEAELHFANVHPSPGSENVRKAIEKKYASRK